MFHNNEHLDEQHRTFADAFGKLLKDVATRQIVEDALKEQLLRFEQQKVDFSTIEAEIEKLRKSLKKEQQNLNKEFDSISHFHLMLSKLL